MPRTLAAALVLAALMAAAPARAGNDGQDFTTIARGRYLTVVGDCTACHTAPGGRPFAGGLPVETPFGIVVSSNITPDQDTGIGAWDDDQFVRALTKGIRRDGSHLYPAMPYPYFTKVSRPDLLAIRAYLSTVPAVRHKVTSDRLPFPFDIRTGMAAWNRLFFTSGRFRRDPGKSTEWNRGAYLVEGLMHCGACHTPKNILGGDKTGSRLEGGSVQGWFAPDITDAARHGLKNWSGAAIVAYLKTGHNHYAGASGPMGEEVADSSSKMTDRDLRAVAIYLKSRPGDDAPAPMAAATPARPEGAAIFGDECAACHASDGAGRGDLIPALAGSPSVQSRNPASLIRIVLDGTRGVGTAAAPTAAAMPGFGWILDDRETAAVLSYIRNAWGNAAGAVSPAQIHDKRSELARHG